VVTFPAVSSLVRLNGSVYMDKTVVKSTALTLGEIAVPSLMPSDEQLALVKAKTEEFISTLPRDDDNKKVLIEGGGSTMHMVLDDEADPVTGEVRQLEYNKETIAIRQDGSLTVSALMHRPLRAAKPWSFGFKGCVPEAYEATEGQCVSHQLVAVTRKSLKLDEVEIEGVFDGVFEDLYPPGCANSPYDIETECGRIETRGWRESGVTIAMIDALCKVYSASLHVVWGEDHKILSVSPPTLELASVCMCGAITRSS
jgi:hypothetical protein